MQICVFLPAVGGESANLHPDSCKPRFTNPKSGKQLEQQRERTPTERYCSSLWMLVSVSHLFGGVAPPGFAHRPTQQAGRSTAAKNGAMIALSLTCLFLSIFIFPVPLFLQGRHFSNTCPDYTMYRVLESIKDDAAQEYQPALAGLTAQSHNLALN